MKMLGLGRDQLRLLPTRDMRLDDEALRDALYACQQARQPVLLAVAVLGSTEYGTMDPVDKVVRLRDFSSLRGLGFSVHVDAAWGGYLATLFRNPDGSLRSQHEMRREYRNFPQKEVHAAFAALERVDSITVDPHKLGYLPYGTGAFVCRDNRAMALLAERADYVFDAEEASDYASRYRRIGQFIPEGSKPGAAAAAVYVVHKVLPLDHTNFGMIPRHTVLAAEAFRECARRFAREMEGALHVSMPFPPDSNLVCLAINPCGNRDLKRADDFTRRLLEKLRCDRHQPVQVKQFFASSTTLRRDLVGDADMTRILAELDIVPDPIDVAHGDDRLTLLRHTLMNPYLIDRENGISYIDRYFEYLSEQLRAL